MKYSEFLESKKIRTQSSGFEPSSINCKLYNFQADIVRWSCRKGRAAIYADCGLGKTPMQLEWARLIHDKTGRPVLILAPLAVSEQTVREGKKFDIPVHICAEQSDVINGINITNYEKLQHFNPESFSGIVLDESSILKHFESKTRTLITDAFRNTEYKLSCTATPAPNDYMELGNQAEFLGIMTRTEMLATFFVHDGGDTSKWRLKGHAEKSYWEWLASWAVVLRAPSDLGYEDGDFILPKLKLVEHIVEAENLPQGNQMALFNMAPVAMTLDERRTARRNSIHERCAKAAELANSDNEQWLIWCDLNNESELLTSLVRDAVQVTGSDSQEHKAKSAETFALGKIRVIVSKPSIFGFGLNFQSCHNQIFVGLSDSYEAFYQAVRRCWRFGQKQEVKAHIVISEQEGAVKKNIERKELDSEKMIAEMVQHTQKILQKDIHGTVRESIEYDPKIPMSIPEWLASEVA